MVTNVLRPCLMMCVQGMTLSSLAVNGAAMDGIPWLHHLHLRDVLPVHQGNN